MRYRNFIPFHLSVLVWIEGLRANRCVHSYTIHSFFNEYFYTSLPFLVFWRLTPSAFGRLQKFTLWMITRNKERFVCDFIAAWVKVMNANPFDLNGLTLRKRNFQVSKCKRKLVNLTAVFLVGEKNKSIIWRTPLAQPNSSKNMYVGFYASPS